VTREAGERRASLSRPPAALVLVCLVTNLAEAGVAVGLGIAGGAAIAPQAAAPPPLALFGDLRWLLVYERSWTTFALGAGALLALRSSVTALQARLAWPGPKPPFGRLAARAALANVALGALLAPFALLLYGFGAFPVSWLYFAAVPSVVVLALLLHEASLSSAWWRHAPGLRPAAWTALTALVLTAAAGLVSLDPVALALPVAALAGLFEALAWRRIVTAVASRPVRRFAPLAPLFALSFVAGALLGAAAGFSAARVPPSAPAGEAAPEALRGRQVVLLATGFASHYEGAPATLAAAPRRARVVRFSYRGSTGSGAPLPYPASATRASLAHLERLMARQVDELARASGRPVDIVAVSEGSAIVEAYLAATPRPPVGTVVLVSPLLDPGAVGYPPAGRDGWGMVAGRGLAVLSSWLAPISTVDLSPNQPFLRSLLADHLRPAAPPPCAPRCQTIRELAVIPLADAVTGALPRWRGVESVVVPAFHSGDLADPAVRAVVAEALEGRRVVADPAESTLARVIGSLAAAWRVPALAPGLS